ncbi:MAG: hypothetical protein WCW31_04620 [Patescibacteria group bacterium]
MYDALFALKYLAVQLLAFSLAIAIPVGIMTLVLRYKPKALPSRPGKRTHGRELLLFFDKNARREAFDSLIQTRKSIIYIGVACCVVDAFVAIFLLLAALLDSTATISVPLAFAAISSLVGTSLIASILRKPFRTIHLVRCAKSAQTEFDILTDEVNRTLPESGFRDQAIPPMNHDNVDQFRVMAKEHHLPQELETRINHAVRVSGELKAAEDALAEEDRCQAAEAERVALKTKTTA